eukprot:3791390-Prymnesium_polylepis.1
MDDSAGRSNIGLNPLWMVTAHALAYMMSPLPSIHTPLIVHTMFDPGPRAPTDPEPRRASSRASSHNRGGNRDMTIHRL